MQFVHIADVHFDIPFSTLSDKDGLDLKRKLEQRDSFKKVIDYIKNNDIKYLFISGDLYEQEYVKESTIEYINKLFKEINKTEIFISPGNHDPYINNSFYKNYNWNKNVHIFNNENKMFSFDDVDIYGYAFDNFYIQNSGVEKIEIENKDKLNILVMHADLDASKNSEKPYNPISTRELENIGFDYIALGHIHATNFEKNKRIIYPGSLTSLGFDELGKHGMIVGDITKDKYDIRFVEVKENELKEINIDVSEFSDVEELIQKIAEIVTGEQLYKIVLCGKRKFDINVQKINDIISVKNLIKIKDETVIGYDVDKIAKENSLRGFFVREILEHKNEYTEKEIEKAIEIGLENL